MTADVDTVALLLDAALDGQHQSGAAGTSSPVWKPDPRNEPQCVAYESKAFEILYGGSAGGGKTDLILGKARTQYTKSLILRRTYPDLERGVIQRSLEFFGDRKHYNQSRHVWEIDNRRIEFGHLEHVGTPTQPKDEVQYAGPRYGLISFDQLEQIPQYGYEFLMSRCTGQVISTANPVGEFVDWIIQRWSAWLDETHTNPAKPGELRWYKRDADGVDVETTEDDPDALSRTFIPAGLKDNPYLGDDYRRVLALLPEPLRSALLNGDWAASITDDAYQVIPRSWVKQAQARWTQEPPKHSNGQILPIRRAGVDVARGGKDKTVFVFKRGRWFSKLIKHPGIITPDGAKVAALYIEACKGDKPTQTNIDVIGVGSSAFDHLKHKFTCVPVNFGAGADEGDGTDVTDKSGTLIMANVRAWAWWGMREALDPDSGNRLALPPDPELLGDLCAPRWKPKGDKIFIESKDDVIKRLGRSPDCGDAIVLANFEGGGTIPAMQPQQTSRWTPAHTPTPEVEGDEPRGSRFKRY